MDQGSPSFEEIFAQQKQNSSSSSSSFPYSGGDNYASTSLGFMTDEPHSLNRRGSQASLGSFRMDYGDGTGSGNGTGYGGHGSNADGSRRDSGESMGIGMGGLDGDGFQSTLLSTAERDANGRIQGHQPSSSSQGYGGNNVYGNGQYGGLNQQNFDSYTYNGNAYQQQHHQQSGMYGQQGTVQAHELFGLSNNPQTQQQHQPYPGHAQQDTPNYLNDTPASAGLDPGTAGSSDMFSMSQQSPYSTGAGPSAATPNDYGQAWTNDQWGQTDDDEKLIAAIAQSISANSSRAPSPMPQSDMQSSQTLPGGNPLQSFTPDPIYNDGSRATSPFPLTSHSPSFSHTYPGHGSSGSVTGASLNSPFQKPQSPPALVMPNNAPSPALPPIVTQPAAQPTGSASQGHALANQMGGMGGLLPPTNPQLEHLSGMMGISPIAPDTDGPQIFVQPSTPISGLKDGRGHFDAALRKAGLAQQQRNQHSQDHSSSSNGQRRSSTPGAGQDPSTNQYHVPPPNPGSNPSSPGLHNNNNGSNASPSPAPQHPLDFAAQMQMQNSSNWGDLGAGLGADQGVAGGGAGVRPRAKSDSHMQMSELDRQTLMYMAQVQGLGQSIGQGQGQMVAPDQVGPGDGTGDDWRNNIGSWLSSMTMNSPGMTYQSLQQQQQAAAAAQQNPPTTVNPNQLPGNDANSQQAQQSQTSVSGVAQSLYFKHMEQQRQLAQLQMQQRHKLSLNTSVGQGQSGSGAGGGVLKYEPGEFSPTSLAFYQQQGLFPLGSGSTNTATAGTTGPSASGAYTAPLGTGASAGFPSAGISSTNDPGSAQYYNTHFANTVLSGNTFQTIPGAGAGGGAGAVAGPSFLGTPAPDMSRRRSFAEGVGPSTSAGHASYHPAAGAGTPGYGVEFQTHTMFGGVSPFGTLDPGRLRGVGAQQSHGHRRAAKSEDLGRGGGWGMGAGGSTTDFLNSITANDGFLVPPLRGRSHSRHSSASSVRSASPALSVSSVGSSFSHGQQRMDLPEGVSFSGGAATGGAGAGGGGTAQSARSAAQAKKLAKMKVTSMATEVAATSRRTNDGVFQCPVPGCGSTFTRHFNLKGHLRSHNDERPYKCLYDGCPKAEIGFARQHDCKRHMLLHKGLRPFECDGCGKKFARLDALTRHHKSEQGQECAVTHPLPVNPDGTAMSESQYKAYKAAQELLKPAVSDSGLSPGKKGGGGRRKSNASISSMSGFSASGDDEVGDVGSGMEDYDRA